MRETTITLGGRAYAVQELPMRRNEAWRKRVMAELVGVAGLIEGAPQTAMTAEGIGALLRAASEKLVGSVDIITGLLFAYAPTLDADRERIETECYDSEVMAAFTEVIKLAFPFGSLLDLAQRLRPSGQTTRPT